MHLLIYLPPLYPSRLAGLLRIYYAHTIDGPSVLAPSPPTYGIWRALLLHTCTCMACLNISGFGQSVKNQNP